MGTTFIVQIGMTQIQSDGLNAVFKVKTLAWSQFFTCIAFAAGQIIWGLLVRVVVNPVLFSCLDVPDIDEEEVAKWKDSPSFLRSTVNLEILLESAPKATLN